jgi:hypothetical protein
MTQQNQKLFSAAVVFFAGWYVLLCTLHLVQQRPLWNDEDAVFRSVENYSAGQMFSEPLAAVQVFPRVYLFLIQQFSKVFDFSLWSLRLPSFIGMTAGFLVWLKIARYGLKERWQYLAFVCSWPASGMLLYYSAELKQYSMDVLAAALFILFLYHQERLQQNGQGRYTAILILLPVLGLFSYPAFFLCTIPLYNLLLSSVQDRSCRKYFCIYGLSVLVILTLSYYFDMRLRPVAEVSQGFSDYFVSFATGGEFLRSLGEGVNNLFSRWFVEHPKYFKSITRIFTGFALIYLFYGFSTSRNKKRGCICTLETIAFVLFMEMFIVGCLRKYPFTIPRTSLFYAPVVLYMTARGIELAGRVHRYFYRFILGLYFVFLGFCIVLQTLVAWGGRLSFYPKFW